MRVAVVKIEKDQRTKPVVKIPEYEIPMLEAEYGIDKVQVLAVETDSRPYPDAQTEYERLKMKYGSREGGSESKVSQVLGVGVSGVNTLRDLMERVQARQEKAEEQARSEAEAAKAAHQAEVDRAVNARFEEEVERRVKARLAEASKDAGGLVPPKDEVKEILGESPAPAQEAPAGTKSQTLGLRK